MNKVAIITDSTSGIEYLEHPYEIFVYKFPIKFPKEKFHSNNKSMPFSFYRQLNSSKKSPTTNNAPLNNIVNFLEKIKAKGYKQAIMITCSKRLSNLYQNAQIAKLYIENFKILIVNSKTTSIGLANMAIEAATLLSEKRSVNYILKYLEKMSNSTSLYFLPIPKSNESKNNIFKKFNNLLKHYFRFSKIFSINEHGSFFKLKRTFSQKKSIKVLSQIVIYQTKHIPKRKVRILGATTYYNNTYKDIQKHVLSKAKHNDIMITTMVSPHIANIFGINCYVLGVVNMPDKRVNI